MDSIYVEREEPSEFSDTESYVRCLLDVVLRLEAEDPDQLKRLLGDPAHPEAA